jgi:hypothetical protein
LARSAGPSNWARLPYQPRESPRSTGKHWGWLRLRHRLFSSFNTMRLPCIITTSLPPPTVFGFAWPPPANLVLQVRSSQPSGDDVKGKNFRQGVLILRLQQVLDSRNASLLGAKTVNALGPFNQCTKPAAPFIAFTSVVWSAALTSLSIMSLVGYISCPPTTGLLESASPNQLRGPGCPATKLQFSSS